MTHSLSSANGASPITGDLSDDALLAALSADNKLAFRELTTRYIDRVVRIAFRVCGNRQDAEDVAQEVFVAVWNHRANWRAGDAAFSTWLYRVTMNRAIDFKRKHRGVQVELTDEIAESTDINADDIVSNRQTQEMLLGCLKELPEKQMLALLYFYYEEMEIPEICMRLSATEDSVRSLLKRGKASMRDILASRVGNEDEIKLIAPYLAG